MERTTVVKGSILEDQATEVTVSSNDVVGLFFLTELVTIVLRLGFSGFTNQRRSNQRTVRMRENREPPKTPATPSMWKGRIRMLCSAWKTSYVVEGATNTKSIASENEP